MGPAEPQPAPEPERDTQPNDPSSGGQPEGAQQLRLLEQLYAYQAELEARNRELLETQEALAAARDRYQTLYETAPVGYITLDRRGIIREANATFAEMLERNVDRLPGRPFSPYLVSGESRAFFSHLRRAMAGDGLQTVDLRMRSSTEQPRDVRLKTRRATAPDGAVELRTSVSDITEQKVLERQARQRDQQLAHLSRVATLGEIATTLAHDLNQPLSAIGTYAETARRSLERAPGDVEQVRRLLGRIVEQVGYAGDIVRTAREFARPDRVIDDHVDLHAGIDDALRLLSDLLRDRGIEASTDLATALPHVKGNRTQLEQVLVNLILNAAEAYDGTAAEARPITIRTRAQSGAAVVEVIDAAVGLDAQAEDRMFDAFYTTKSEGLGMGLAICRSVVESHGGRIWAKANRRGGTTVTFRLPAADGA